MRYGLITAAIIAIAVPYAPTSRAKTVPQAPLEIAVNRGVVELETADAAGISIRIAEDLANVIDDGATRRVLPVVGKSSLQTLTDLKLLRGIDLAILQTDVLDFARQAQAVFWRVEPNSAYLEEQLPLAAAAAR